MDKTVPPGAALLLDFIGGIEAPKGYGTIYGNNQDKLAKPLTDMTVGEIIDAQKSWTARYKSSACGRYQFMRNTLIGLSSELGLRDSQIFDADFQDRLGYHLLKRRGLEAFLAGTITRTEFGKRLAQEWASFPVLASTKGGSRDVVRGQSYYAGDGLNKSLVKPEVIEAVLAKVKAAPSAAANTSDAVPVEQLPTNPAGTPPPSPPLFPPPATITSDEPIPKGFWARFVAAFRKRTSA